MTKPETAIQISNLSYRYIPQGPPVLSIPHWRCSENEQIFISGDSGCGKSTFLKLLTGLILPDAGEVRIFGCDTAQLNAAKRDRFRANYIGVVFQQFNLIPFLSVVDNVLLAQRLCGKKRAGDPKRCLHLLSSVGIEQSLYGRKAQMLSVGQQQRIAIARALINKPRLIIADEPTSGLDGANTKRFMDVLFDVVKEEGSTLIFLSHNQNLAQRFSNKLSFSEISTASSAGSDCAMLCS